MTDQGAAGRRVRRRRSGLAPASTQTGRGPRWWRRLPPRWRLALRVALGGFAVLCLSLGGMVAYAALTLPDVNTIGQATGTIRLLDRNGKLIGEYGHNNQNRTTVPLTKISPLLQQATIATEDRNFYDEGAINFGRVAKALFVDVIARRPSQGASTITQQLAKLAFFGPDAQKSPFRKLREALLANEIDRMFTKDQILEKYLNLIYYGHGAYGVEDASQTYFGKHAGDLDLREASLIAGLPQAPSLYDPFLDRDAAFARQHVVLVSMVSAGKVSQADADAADPTTGDATSRQAKQQKLIAELNSAAKKPQTAALAPHFAQYVREQLDAQFKDDPTVTGGSLTVTTTLDLDTQQKAQDSVTRGVTSIGHGANNGALLMLDSHSGDILAMVGSASFTEDSIDGQFNVVTGLRRPGSSFKPYVYEEAFKEGALKPDSILDDTRAESKKLGGVQDFDHSFLGQLTAARALLLSRNVPAEQAMSIAGIDNVIQFAHTLGISSDLAENANTAIGSSAVRMIDHAAGYAAFSNGGHTVQPRSILKVVDADGHVLLDNPVVAQGPTVMTEAQAYAVTKILLGYADQWGLGFRHQTAGKSGTTDSFVDAWYMTYTPDWVVATWAGHTEAANQGEIGMDQVFGTTVGKAMAVPFVNSLPSSQFHSFSYVPGSASDCNPNDAGLAAAAGCPTPTPTPSPTPTATPTAVPSPTEGGVLTLPPIFGTPSPTPGPTPSPSPSPRSSPSPSPTPTAGGGLGGPSP